MDKSMGTIPITENIIEQSMDIIAASLKRLQ